MPPPGPPNGSDGEEPPDLRRIPPAAAAKRIRISGPETVEAVPIPPTGLDEGGSTFADWEAGYEDTQGKVLPRTKRGLLKRIYDAVTKPPLFELDDEQTVDEWKENPLSEELAANIPVQEQVGWIMRFRRFRRKDLTDLGLNGLTDPPTSDLDLDPDDSGMSEDGTVQMVGQPSVDPVLGVPTEIPKPDRKHSPAESPPPKDGGRGRARAPTPIPPDEPIDERFHTPTGLKRKLAESERRDALDAPTPPPGLMPQPLPEGAVLQEYDEKPQPALVYEDKEETGTPPTSVTRADSPVRTINTRGTKVLIVMIYLTVVTLVIITGATLASKWGLW